MVLFPPPFYFVFDISNLLSYIQNNFSYELARPIMGTIFLVIKMLVYFCDCRPMAALMMMGDSSKPMSLFKVKPGGAKPI